MTDNQLDRSQDSHTYLYDTAQRFTKMERGTIGGTPSFYQGYTLDALANWSSFNNNGTTESRSHDVMNAITFRGATSLSHDLNGNLTNDSNQKYIWDELNRLIEVRDSGNNIICDYYYNADNLRVEKHHAGGSKEQFYYDDATVLVETDGSQTKVREYVNGGQYIDEVILVVNGSTYNYYMSDLRYCVTGFIDSTGAVVERARYDGYGKRTLLDAAYATITTANVDQSYGYTGIRHDNESGLQYYRARYFDNDLGRFVNHDPLEYIDGMNLYSSYFIPLKSDSLGFYSSSTNKHQVVVYDSENKKMKGKKDKYVLSKVTAGKTKWKFKNSFDVKVSGKCCYIKNLKFEIKFDVYYPKKGQKLLSPLTRANNPDAGEYTATDEHVQIILDHEMGHVAGVDKYASILFPVIEEKSEKCCAERSSPWTKSDCKSHWQNIINGSNGNEREEGSSESDSDPMSLLNTELRKISKKWHDHNNYDWPLIPVTEEMKNSYLSEVETEANSKKNAIGDKCPFQ